MIPALDNPADFIEKKYRDLGSLKSLNEYLHSETGIVNYFETKRELSDFQEFSYGNDADSFCVGGSEWGAIQTPREITDKTCRFLKSIGVMPDLVLEPTFGTGNFILSALDVFPGIKKVYGIEIHKGHEWAFKSKLLHNRLRSKRDNPEFRLFNESIFEHEFDMRYISDAANPLIIGNPPWVTNSELSARESTNVPGKSNFKGFSGLDAITGKSNFDLAESVIMGLLDRFSALSGHLAMLCKNTVIRNLVRELPSSGFKIREIRMIPIDSRAIFGRSVDASLLVVRLGQSAKDYTCTEISFDNPGLARRRFGWTNDSFVSNIRDYQRLSDLEGQSCFGWRSGIKHDCSAVLELTMHNGVPQNKAGESPGLESERIYPLLKGSMLKGFLVSESARRIILTQRRTNEDTSDLRRSPKLWAYLRNNRQYFEKRRSSIYKRNLDFAIFGVGDYSFAPFKVAIAGMYKEPRFSLCAPIGGKPVMLDDTCYFIGFDRHSDALFACTILNSELARDFFQSIVFTDTKRPYTKENLSRINLLELGGRIPFGQIQQIWRAHGFKGGSGAGEAEYGQFLERLS